MAAPVTDITLPENAPKTLLSQKHVEYIAAYGTKKGDYEYSMMEYLRMSGMYWGLTAMDMLGSLDRMDRQTVVDFIKSCQHECGGIGASVNHDPHLLYTTSAVQILSIYDCQDAVNIDKVVSYVSSLQQEDGSFVGDKWGEKDTRFSFCALLCLALVKRLDAINVDKAVDFVLSCRNFDGGFGSRPGSESHSGLIYCCIGTLSITGRLHLVNADLLGWWLCERQLKSGGLNGRPEKLPDLCYSWWVLSTLKILGRLSWIDKDMLVKFIHACQDEETGGFCDRPGNVVDPYHTLFGLAGLSLLGDKAVKDVNPVFCMPEYVIQRLGIKIQTLDSKPLPFSLAASG